MLYQLSYAPTASRPRRHRQRRQSHHRKTMNQMGQGGLEPPTPRLSSVCSNQLSYWPQALARTRAREPSSLPRPDHGMGEGCADGADPKRSGTPREITRWPARLAGRDGGWIGDVPETRPSLRRTAAPASFADDVVSIQDPGSRRPKPPPHTGSLKGGDPAAGSPTATLLRLHPSH